jgi:hypothetical protein
VVRCTAWGGAAERPPVVSAALDSDAGAAYFDAGVTTRVRAARSSPPSAISAATLASSPSKRSWAGERMTRPHLPTAQPFPFPSAGFRLIPSGVFNPLGEPLDRHP